MQSHSYGRGRFSHSHALRVALTSAQCFNPMTGEPWSEAMLLGLGGGLSAGSLLWHFRTHNASVLTLGFHHRWNEPEAWYRNVLERVGAEGSWRQATGHRRADRALESALRRGHAAVCWVDEHHLPYLHVNEAFDGCFTWVTTATDLSGDQVTLAEVWGQPMTVQLPQFQAARRRIADHRNRLLEISGPQSAQPLKQSLVDAIADHVDHLTANSSSVGLGALRAWARAMADRTGRKGWARQFQGGAGLASVFRSMYEGIVGRGMDGAGLRRLYADFLREASGLLDAPTLADIAVVYDDCAARWTDLALTPLLGGEDGTLPYLEALRGRFDALTEGTMADIAAASAALNQLNAELDAAPPWTPTQQRALLDSLSERAQALWLLERRAASTLRRWLNSVERDDGDAFTASEP